MNDSHVGARAKRHADTSVATPRRITSRELLGEARELLIDHTTGQYRLRRTRQGKLILVK